MNCTKTGNTTISTVLMLKKSFFRIGEDVDKYMQASFVLELTEKMVPEDLPQPRLFNLLIDFLDAMESREKRHETLVLAYEVKALAILGHLSSA